MKVKPAMDADWPSDWAGPVLELPDGPQRPSPARIYDYWLGGKDNFGVDREVAEQVEEVAPWVVASALANRTFIHDSVEELARGGIDQFVDVGSGLPGEVNVHDVAQRVNPQAQVVYIDHDPIVITHSRAWLESHDGVLVLPGDARRPRGDHRGPRNEWTAGLRSADRRAVRRAAALPPRR
jgi:hypothetical protein